MLDRLKRRLGRTDTEQDALLHDLLADAQAFVLGYTGRDVLPDPLAGAVCELAAGSYNQLGLEGVGAHGEGSLSETMDRLPVYMRAQLDMFRVGKVL